MTEHSADYDAHYDASRLYPPEPEPCEGCWYATGEMMVCAGFCDLIHDEASAQAARALFDYGVSRGRVLPPASGDTR